VDAEKRRVKFRCVCKVGKLTVLEGLAEVMPPRPPKAR